MFAVLFAVPGLVYGIRRSNAVATFWSAYILARPFGASFADWLGFGKSDGGLGLGHPLTMGVTVRALSPVRSGKGPGSEGLALTCLLASGLPGW
jgi:uncharacterized membrane-anchored protein